MMRHSKSEVLDELRYEIGKLGDTYQSAIQLIEEAVKKIVRSDYIYSTSCIYKCDHNGFYLLTRAGAEHVPNYVPFGHNHHSLCAIRGKKQVFVTKRYTQIYIPCYQGHHLIGMLVVYSLSFNIINRDDLDFLSETVSYLKGRLNSLGDI